MILGEEKVYFFKDTTLKELLDFVSLRYGKINGLKFRFNHPLFNEVIIIGE